MRAPPVLLALDDGEEGPPVELEAEDPFVRVENAREEVRPADLRAVQRRRRRQLRTCGSQRHAAVRVIKSVDCVRLFLLQDAQAKTNRSLKA